jgi:sec-independent protein translocase protein TatA
VRRDLLDLLGDCGWSAWRASLKVGMGIENPVHLIFIAVVALVVLGPKRLPEMARALGKGMREFRQAMSGEEDETERSDPHGGA